MPSGTLPTRAARSFHWVGDSFARLRGGRPVSSFTMGAKFFAMVPTSMPCRNDSTPAAPPKAAGDFSKACQKSEPSPPVATNASATFSNAPEGIWLRCRTERNVALPASNGRSRANPRLASARPVSTVSSRPASATGTRFCSRAVCSTERATSGAVAAIPDATNSVS